MKLTPSEPDLRTIVERIENGDIDLQPEFQRQEVWSIPKKRKLVDTILRGWSIPPVHLVEIDQSRLEVLDGQQRLSAVRDFINNKFSIDGRITPVDGVIQSLHGRFFRQLEVSVRRRIEQYPLRCFKISDYAPDEPSELFYRLNQPTALTAGEQRNALFGPARQQLKDLVGYFESSGNDKSSLFFSNVRLAYDDVIARLLFFLEQGNFGTKSSEFRVSERFRMRQPFDSEVEQKARRSIELFSHSRSRAEPTRFNKASVLSWLIFFSRFTNTEPELYFMKHFSRLGRSKSESHYVAEAALLFEDRASLRVTDVSSVVYRDFCLWYVYQFDTGLNYPTVIPREIIVDVYHEISTTRDRSFEEVLDDKLDIARWSASL